MEDNPDKSIFELFPPEEFKMTQTPLPDGGVEYNFELSGRTKKYLERVAEAKGKTVAELIKEQAFSED